MREKYYFKNHQNAPDLKGSHFMNWKSSSRAISIKENGLKVQHIITKETKKKKKTLKMLERGKKIKLHAKDQESEWHSIFQKQ